jgi:hypothetical protein
MTITHTRPSAAELQPTANCTAVPGPGTWTIHTSSYMAVTSRSRLSHPHQITAGTVEVEPDGSGQLHLDIVASGTRRWRLRAHTKHVDAGNDGFARYRLTGLLERIGDGPVPIELMLAFHGVYRRSGHWAWFSGGTGGPTRRHRHRAPGVVLDLLATPTLDDAPTDAASEPT